MNNARFCAALIGIDVPAIRCGSDKHRARLRAQFAILLKRKRDGTRAADHLNSENRILVDISRRSKLSDYSRPIGVHLIGENHRERSVHSLTELETINLNYDLAIRPDVNK